MSSENALTRAKKRQALDFIRAQQFELANKLLLEICRIDKGDSESWFLLGNTSSALGDQIGAEQQLHQALSLAPDVAQIHFNLGNVLRLQQRYDEAADAYRQAVRLKPDYSAALTNLGASLHDAGQILESIEPYRAAIQITPKAFPVYVNLGQSLFELGKFDEALATFQSAVNLKPKDANALLGLGRCQLELGQTDRAMATLNSANASDPYNAKVLALLGFAYMRKEEPSKAFELTLKAIELRPQDKGIRFNKCVMLTYLGQYDDAKNAYKELLQVDPAYAPARFGLSNLNLLLANWIEGWADYRWLWRYRENKRLAPEVGPEALIGSCKRLFIVHEQGLGDELFFLSFLHADVLRDKQVVYCAQKKLVPILSRCVDTITVTSDLTPPQNTDITIHVGDLPYLTQMTRTADIPRALALTPRPDLTASVRSSLAGFGPPPYIGVTWRAGTFNDRSLLKFAPVARLAHVLRERQATIIVVQRRPTTAELELFRESLGRPAHDLSELNENLEQMLALLSLLDDYVGVSNTNMHLCAGLGRTARVLVPNPPEWRWMASGEESPWFPGFRVYRQTLDMDWSAAFDKLAEDLAVAFPASS